MPDTSPNLDLPYLMPAQAQKHVTHNEALERLDALAQLVVEAFGATTPPANPGVGLIWAVTSGATGDWAGKTGKLALRVAGGWVFIAPREGWRAWGREQAQLRIWRGSSWQVLPMEQLGSLGIGTTADAVNRLAVSAEASLFSHDGAGHQMKINKAAAGQTASLLYQTNWSGRAEIGLTGNDDFSVKVSADGSAWTEALRVARATGIAAFPAGLTVAGALPYTRATLLGPVSQATGQPTGAVIERGGNANGDYVRWADGTQICSHKVTLGYTAANALLATWAFPAAFAAGSVPTVLTALNPNVWSNMPSGLSRGDGALTPANVSAGSTLIYWWARSGAVALVSGNQVEAYALATGRWF